MFRDAYGQAVATLIRIFGDISLAEDAVQDSFVVATIRWGGSSPSHETGRSMTSVVRPAVGNSVSSLGRSPAHGTPRALRSWERTNP